MNLLLMILVGLCKRALVYFHENTIKRRGKRTRLTLSNSAMIAVAEEPAWRREHSRK